MQDSRRGNGILKRWQRSRIQLVEANPALVDGCYCVDEFLETYVAIACLAGEIAFFIGSVAHVEAGMSVSF